jgi:hypothetical protein
VHSAPVHLHQSSGEKSRTNLKRNKIEKLKIMKMKNVILASVVMLVSTFAFAEGPSSKFAVVAAKETSVFKVIYEGSNVGNVLLTIYNENGSIVYTEAIKGIEKFIRPVNFDGMVAGEYNIEISDSNGKQSQKVSVGSTVNFKKGSVVKGAHVAKVGADAKYLLSVANNGAKEINVRILDGDSNLVFSEKISATGDFAKVYSLKQVQGNPTFEIISNDGYSKIVK